MTSHHRFRQYCSRERSKHLIPLLHALRMKIPSLFILALLTVLIGNISCTTGSIHLTVGGKLDIEAQLLTKIYVLLLRHAGFDVTEKAKLGTNDPVFRAITS